MKRSCTKLVGCHALAVVLMALALVTIARPKPAAAESGGAAAPDRALAGRLDVGQSSTCAINDSGGVSCWGRATELGTGSADTALGFRTTPSPLLTMPAPGTALAVSLGEFFGCALLTDGQVSCWGSAPWFSSSTPIEPVTLPAPGKATAITAGENFVCAILIDGHVACWGRSDKGQLGRTTISTIESAPVGTVALPGSGVAVAISASGTTACAALSDGALACWGSGAAVSSIALPAGERAVGVAVNENTSGPNKHSCVLFDSGKISCWGDGAVGQLGYGSSVTSRPSPSTAVPMPGGGLVKAVAVGSKHSCALLVVGTVACWGLNEQRALGINPPLGNYSFDPVIVPQSAPATSIAADGKTTCVRLNSGKISCWGDDHFGQVGNGAENGNDRVPSARLALGPAYSVSAGPVHTCAVLVSGDLSCWGNNSNGQLSTAAGSSPDAPANVVGVSRAVSVSNGFASTCVVVNTAVFGIQRGLRCWGSNQSGKLGNNGAGGELRTPPTTDVLSNSFLQVSGADSSVCAVSTSLGPSIDRSLWCWGANDGGQLPLPGPGPFLVPTKVNILGQPVDIAVGALHGCVVFLAGLVSCWGRNRDGAVNGTASTGSLGLTSVSLPGPASQVTTGAFHSCALLVDGRVTCWGSATSGQIGTGPIGTSYVSAPAIVSLPSPGAASAIVAGATFTCALLTDGKVTCWGDNYYGQLGTGDLKNLLVPSAPVALPAPGTAKALSAGTDHVCAVLSNGDVSCWGSDLNGKLGKGLYTGATQPVPSASFALPLGAPPVATTTTTTTPPVPSPDSEFVSLVPVRLLDSRSVGATVDGLFSGGGRRGAGSVLVLQVGGRGGVPLDARGVALNVTVTDAGGAPGGYVSVYGCDVAQPNVSTLNYLPGQTIANSLIVKPGADGTVCVYTFTDTQLIVDVTGFMPVGSSFRGVTPGRVLDTRSANATVDSLFSGGGRRGAGSVLELPVGGRGGVPVDAKAVAINVTVVDAGSAPGGYVTVFPCGQAQPNVSTLNYPPGGIVANAMLASLGVGGKLCVYTFTDTHVLVDVNGFFPSASTYRPTGPSRLVDTRSASGTIDGLSAGGGRRGAGSVLTFQVTGRAGVPVSARSAVLNVTVTDSSDDPGGYVTVFPCDGPQPNTSNLNYAPGQTIAASTLIKLSATGTVCAYTFTSTQLLVDINGTFD